MTVIANAGLVLKDSQGNKGIVKSLTDNDIDKISNAITDVGQVVDPATHMPIEATTASVGVVQLATAQDITNGTAGKVVDAKELINFAQTLPAVNAKPSKYLGEQIVSYLPLSDVKAHLLDGTVLNNTNYPEFITYVEALYASNSSLPCFTTESTWQANVTANGVCSKFVVNTTDHTVRLPKMGSQILTKGSAQSISAKTLSANIGLGTSVSLSGSTSAKNVNMGFGDYANADNLKLALNSYNFGNSTQIGHYAGKKNLTIISSSHSHTLSGSLSGSASINQDGLNTIAQSLSVSSNHFEDVYYYIVVKN